MRGRPLAAALIGAGALACTLAGPPPSRAATRVPPRVEAPPSYGVAQRVLAASNEARAAEGHARMEPDRELDRIALDFALELSERGQLDHYSVRAGRRTLGDRLGAATRRPRLAGENLASVRGEPGMVGSRAVELWLRSESHRSNLLNADFTHAGIGVAQGADGFWYIVQLYAAYR